MIEQILDFTELEFGAVSDPGLLHQAVVFLSNSGQQAASLT